MRSIALFTTLSLLSFGIPAKAREIEGPHEAPTPTPLVVRQAAVPEPTLLVIREAEHETPATEEPAAEAHTIFDALADCESGKWDRHGQPIHGSADWDESSYFEGGLQFDATTWAEFREPWMPDTAAYASREQEIWVAQKVVAKQGWDAWPVCSWKVGAQ